MLQWLLNDKIRDHLVNLAGDPQAADGLLVNCTVGYVWVLGHDGHLYRGGPLVCVDADFRG
jgi:hypothetical protein